MVKPQMDVQSWLASLRPQPWRWHRDLTWPAIPTSLLVAAASGVASRRMTALSAPTMALACRRRLLDPAWARSGESMAAPLVMSKLDRCVYMCVVELVERSARAAPGVFILGHLAEENKASLF
jgi:hypothetical protein